MKVFWLLALISSAALAQAVAPTGGSSTPFTGGTLTSDTTVLANFAVDGGISGNNSALINPRINVGAGGVQTDAGFTINSGNECEVSLYRPSDAFRAICLNNGVTNASAAAPYIAYSGGNVFITSSGDLSINAGVGNKVSMSQALVNTNTKTAGQITLSGGTGTATVVSGTHCVCTDDSATPVVLRCTVSSTTLTASEAGASSTHVINYLCL